LKSRHRKPIGFNAVYPFFPLENFRKGIEGWHIDFDIFAFVFSFLSGKFSAVCNFRLCRQVCGSRPPQKCLCVCVSGV